MGVIELSLLNCLVFCLLPIGIIYYLDKIFQFKKKFMSTLKSYFLYKILIYIILFSVVTIIILILPEINWITSIRINSAIIGSMTSLLHRDKTS